MLGVRTAEVLFISGRDAGQSLKDLAEEIFAILDLPENEERFSSNYPPHDHYFVGYAKNVVVEVCDADDDTTPDYPFLVSLEEPSWRAGSKLIDSNPAKIAATLASAGLRVSIDGGLSSRTP